MNKLVDCGIYEIRHLLTGRRYVGSSRKLGVRFADHRRLLRQGRHTNPRLQRAWNRDGEAAFRFTVLAVLERDELLASEQRLLDLVRATGPRPYNAAVKCGSPMAGRKASAATKKKLSIARRQHFAKPGVREALSESMSRTRAERGLTERSREKMKAYWASPRGQARKAAVGEMFRKCWDDPALRERMRAERRQRVKSAEERRESSERQRGRKFSPETIAKMCLGQQRRRAAGRASLTV